MALGGPRQRALLAILLLHANQVVSTDGLVDALWGTQPPPTAANTVQYYVSQLRKLLGADRIVTQPPGYLIRVDPGALDLESFERLLARGDADSLREALALWRGPALADVAYETFAQPEIARLEELRVVAIEKRVDADLDAGRHHELVGELEKLVVEHPLRERLRGQLMLALYRSGRQAEALAAYRAARSALVEELGVEPGQALQELERAMLRHDPSLESDAAVGAGVATATRAILAVSLQGAKVDPVLALAEALARRPARELIVATLVSDGSGLADDTALLAERRDALAARGVAVRVTAYTSMAPGADAVALATEQASRPAARAGAAERARGRGARAGARRPSCRRRRVTSGCCADPHTHRPARSGPWSCRSEASSTTGRPSRSPPGWRARRTRR